MAANSEELIANSKELIANSENAIVTSENSVTTSLTFPSALNYDCLCALYEWLGFKDSMNLTEAFKELQCVADSVYKRKFSEFTFDFEEPIDLVFHHIGPFVRSLTLILDEFDYTEKDLKDISDACKDLQTLILKEFDRRSVKENPFRGGSDNLEVITLNRCSLGNDSDFFESFTNLRCLNIIQCREINNIALRKCFQNNVMLTSFVCDGPYQFYPHLLQLLPNLERLCLHYNRRLTTNSFNNFPNLRFLTLHCWGQNVNDILTELARTNTLVQLELNDIRIDANTFNIINTFQNLELLVVTTHTFEFGLPDTLPPRLTSLKLGGIGILQRQIRSLTNQLIHLEHILLANCYMNNNGVPVRDFDSVADFIVQAATNQIQANRQLSVILSNFGDNLLSKNVVSGRLRICNYLKTSSTFQISFPGMADQ